MRKPWKTIKDGRQCNEVRWREWKKARLCWKAHTFSVSFCSSTFSNAAPCNTNFTSPGGYIETPQQARSWYNTNLDCTYTVTVYMGYGVEIQVNSSHCAFVIDPVSGNDLNYCGNPVLLFYSWKVKCVISVPPAINRIAKIMIVFTQVLRAMFPCQALVGQMLSLRSNSPHWLIQCCCPAGWKCFISTKETQCCAFQKSTCKQLSYSFLWIWVKAYSFHFNIRKILPSALWSFLNKGHI